MLLWWRYVQTLLKADLPVSSFHYSRKLKWHGTHATLLECQFATHDMPKEEGSVFLG
jgi:hypothetical protein